MKKFCRNYLANNLFFWAFATAALLLLVAGFFAPPVGYIDNSVLIAAGEINGSLAIGSVIKAIDAGGTASIKHNNTEVTIKNDSDDE